MSLNGFNELYSLIKHDIEEQDTIWREANPEKETLTVLFSYHDLCYSNMLDLLINVFLEQIQSVFCRNSCVFCLSVKRAPERNTCHWPPWSDHL